MTDDLATKIFNHLCDLDFPGLWHVRRDLATLNIVITYQDGSVSADHPFNFSRDTFSLSDIQTKALELRKQVDTELGLSVEYDSVPCELTN